MPYRRLVVALFLCAVPFVCEAAEVPFDLASQASGTTVVVPIDPGDVAVVAKNAIPGVTYRLTGEQNRVLRLPAVSGGAADCADAAKYVAHVLAGVNDETAVTAARAKIAASACTEDQKTAITKTFDKATTLEIGEYTIAKGSDLPIVLQRTADQPRTWTLLLQPKKSAEEIAEERKSEDNTQLKRLIDLTEKQPSATIKKCSYADGCTSDAVVINSDQQSVVVITGIPKKGGTVRVTAGEDFKCPILEGNEKTFTVLPDVLVIPLALRTRFLNSLPFVEIEPTKPGLKFYGMPSKKETRKEFCSGERSVTFPQRIASRPVVPLMLRGDSDLVSVHIEFNDGTRKSFQIPLRYQLFWLDAGGFFAFARVEEEEVVKEAAGEGKVKVTALRTHRNVQPSTGIVVNIHPGNYPHFAVQFGIASNQERAPNYYLGFGARLREVGKRGLATFAAGMAAIETTRFPGLTVSDTAIAADSPFLAPRTKYDFQPYFSISLGFSFGGVSEKTNVATSVVQAAQSQ